VKALLITLGVLLVIFVAAQAYISTDVAKTEIQPYERLWHQGDLEVRYYPSAVMATVRGSIKEYRTSANRHFRVLAGYIFGGNEEKESIAMTSPVHMTFDEHGSEMSFVMPKDMQLETLPKPHDRGIHFSESGEKYVVAIRFGGWANDSKIKDQADRLMEQLEQMGVEPISAPWYMGYNPPFQLINRRNEVAVEISAEDAHMLNKN
jgi:hypothetical protein